ncbi:benzoate 4-monooxygenase cytochrome-like protein P450, partial [Aureobasidium melanogenum]
MLESIVPIIVHNWPVAVAVLVVSYFVRNYFYHGLNKYPGPVLAGFTDWWRFFDVLGRRPDITHLKLHRQYGDIVRLGPNTLSFANPKALKTIYGLNKGFTKSGFYPVQQSVSKGKRLPSLFSTTDESYHANLRRSVNNAFSMSQLVQYEPAVTETVEVFLNQTDKLYAKPGQVCDFAQWLQYFAFDVIGQITYSKRHGFVEKNEDIDGMVGYLGRLFSYVAPVGQMPWLDLLFLKNPLVLLLDRLGVKLFAFPVTTFAVQRMSERLSEMQSQGREKGTEKPDLLSMFLKAQTDRPEFMTDQRVLTMAVSMAFAGSETTAISLAAVFYYLLRNPRCYQRLMQELDDAVREGRIQNRPTGAVTWAESQQLPYLDACIKEAFRMHPAAGLPLERVTPPQGIEIDGHFIPGGTIVGCNAWVIHKREEVFGSNVDSYIPERWLDVSKEQLKEMNGTLFQFGAGARTCIGKNISLLEMYKLIPAFLRRFEVQFDDPSRDWKLHNGK